MRAGTRAGDRDGRGGVGGPAGEVEGALGRGRVFDGGAAGGGGGAAGDLGLELLELDLLEADGLEEAVLLVEKSVIVG